MNLIYTDSIRHSTVVSRRAGAYNAYRGKEYGNRTAAMPGEYKPQWTQVSI